MGEALELSGQDCVLISSGPLLRPWVSATVHLHHMLHGKLGIALCSRKALMAQQLLNSAQVGALLQHMGAECVPECMGMEVGRQPLGDCNCFYDTSYATRCEATTSQVYQ